MKITIYTKSNCPNCDAAKQLLTSKNMEYEEVDMDDDARRANFTNAYPDIRGMPQIFIGDQRVGGLLGLQAALEKMS
jgi:glutaredoxin